jgi:hypothetical protein
MLDDASPQRARPIRIRWWMWIIALALLLTAIAVAVHVHGLSQHAAVLREIAARGLPVKPSDLLRDLPAIDVDRQERLRLALAAFDALPERPDRMPGTQLAVSVLDEAEQVRFQQLMADAAPMLAQLDGILAEGPAWIAAHGWMTRDPQQLDTMTLVEKAGMPLPYIGQARCAMSLLAAQAYLAADPTDDLARMGRLDAAMSKPGVALDALSLFTSRALRDRAHLILAAHGRLPRAARDAWVDEPPAGHDRTITTWERCMLFGQPVDGQQLTAFIPNGGRGVVGDLMRSIQALGWTVFLGHDLACGASQLADAELRQRGEAPLRVRTMPFGLNSALALSLSPSGSLLGAADTQGAYSARLHRVLALLADEHRQGAGLPADHATAATMLPAHLILASSPDAPAIVYQRLGPARVRIGLDPSAPKPPSVRIDHWKPGNYTEIGQPPSTLPERGTPWSLEVDFDAILIPPPESESAPKRRGMVP